jgi:hypothetical protein
MPTPNYSARRQTSSGIPGWIKKLGPYQSLFLLMIPISLVEPMKLVALAVAGKGHWVAGTGMIVIAYAGSLFIVERLFRLVKPKLLKIYWFARLWSWFVIIREKTLGWFARFIPFYPLMKQERPRGWSSDPARTVKAGSLGTIDELDDTSRLAHDDKFRRLLEKPRA